MKEIKFRAWDKTKQFMIKEYAHNGAYGELYTAGFHGSAYSDKGCPDLILMQYTGLKDKAGNEIYEGDVVKNNWYNCNDRYIGNNWIVKYGEHTTDGNDFYTSCALGFYYDKITNQEHEKGEYNILNMPTDAEANEQPDLEIIGNIHENPELLGGDDERN